MKWVKIRVLTLNWQSNQLNSPSWYFVILIIIRILVDKLNNQIHSGPHTNKSDRWPLYIWKIIHIPEINVVLYENKAKENLTTNDNV